MQAAAIAVDSIKQERVMKAAAHTES